MKQERAQHTRRALLRAAAGEFDQHGYAGTSLSRVSRAAGVTMGALTFHFPTKASLADAVRADAVELTRAALGGPAEGGRTAEDGGPAEGGATAGDRAPAGDARTDGDPPARDSPGGADSAPSGCDTGEVARLTDVLTRLLQDEPSVSAAARLAWEQPGSADNWYASWIPVLRGHLTRHQPGVPGPRAGGSNSPGPQGPAARHDLEAQGPAAQGLAAQGPAAQGDPDGQHPAAQRTPHGQGPGDRMAPTAAAADAQDLEILVHCLVVGSEALRRGVVPVGGATAPTGDELRQRLRRLWHRTLAGPSA
ncbi:TetR family transcriptional regulator [Kitasatospora sp. NPDC058263]